VAFHQSSDGWDQLADSHSVPQLQTAPFSESSVLLLMLVWGEVALLQGVE